MQLESMEDVAREASLWLDREYPGWEDKINLDRFDMGDEDMCVGFYVGAPWVELFGRFADEVGNPPYHAFASGRLTDFYRDEILNRRAAKAATSA